jgi:hypothetical protein
MPDSVKTAQTFLENLFAGEFAKAMESFDPQMRAQLNDRGLSQLWQQTTSLFGKPVRQSGTRAAKTLSQTADIVYLSWDFEKERIDARIVINNTNHIIGLFFETPVIR